MSDSQTGTVKGFNSTKGFGFITPINGGDDIFVSLQAIQKAGLETLEIGQTVTLIVTKHSSGKLQADDILVTS
ncbi:cold shock domain-containing protein [Pseudomonas putida]